jgi:hypothetical protein
MRGDDSDGQQIDRLVSELTAKDVPTWVDRRAGTRWSHVRLHMPSERTPSVGQRLAVASEMVLPYLPDVDFRRFFRMPGPETTVRIWVALGVLHSASMTFWPYPKTYLWGLVLYLVCLGVALVNGVWGARLSWDARLGAAHTVSLGTAVWAVALAAAEALPPS